MCYSSIQFSYGNVVFVAQLKEVAFHFYHFARLHGFVLIRRGEIRVTDGYKINLVFRGYYFRCVAILARLYITHRSGNVYACAFLAFFGRSAIAQQQDAYQGNAGDDVFHKRRICKDYTI